MSVRDCSPSRWPKPVRLHLVDQFGDGAARAPRRRGFGRLTRAKLMEYLEHSLDSDISLAALAGLTEMTIAEFSAAFTATFGTTPYPVRPRPPNTPCEETTGYDGGMEITDIGMNVGFSTPSHFAHDLQRTPRRYVTERLPAATNDRATRSGRLETRAVAGEATNAGGEQGDDEQRQCGEAKPQCRCRASGRTSTATERR